VDQRDIPQHKNIASKAGVSVHNGFFIQSAVD